MQGAWRRPRRSAVFRLQGSRHSLSPVEGSVAGLPGPDALGDLLGFEHLEAPEGEARARVPVSERLLQPAGLLHGGVYATLAETVASRATFLAVRADGMIAMGQSNATTFLRSVRDGTINASGVARHRGRTTWVWDVEMSDDDGRLCALSRVVIAVRPLRPPGDNA
jgi:1,4-dihydroxy-2-naphthoyl-CoA hydrolase